MSNPPKPAGLSLYANLLDDAPGTSAGAAAAAAAPAPKRPINASLQFQPIRRPQPAAARTAGAKPGIFAKPPGGGAAPAASLSGTASSATSSTAAAPAAPAPPPPPANPATTTTLADWANLDDDDYYHGGGGANKRRRKRKNAAAADARAQTNWGEIYDPTRPTNVDEYLASDARVWEIREWRAVLYRHRKRRGSGGSERNGGSGGEEAEGERRGAAGHRFAPPPASYAAVPPPVEVPDDATGDDAYARRLALSQGQPQGRPQGQSQAPPPPPSPPPPQRTESNPAPPEIEIAANPKLPPAPYSATISSAPVMYAPPPEPPTEPDDAPADAHPDAFHPRSRAPGQQGFAQRLMGKYGWTSGTGLGANASGITSALHVKQRYPGGGGGGGKVTMGATKIVGGKRKPGTEDEGYGPMSEVVVLRGMLNGMTDLEGEVAEGLGQEIGEECGEKYGRVERLRIDVPSRQVFIKFTDAVSALRAVSELNGRVFNGNAIVARFFDKDRFEQGVFV